MDELAHIRGQIIASAAKDLDRVFRMASATQHESGCHLVVVLNAKLARYALRLVTEAFDARDYELASIVEIAVMGKASNGSTIADMMDRVVSLQKHAKRTRDKKLGLIVSAAVRNSAGR